MEGQVAQTVQLGRLAASTALDRAKALSSGRTRAGQSQGRRDLTSAYGLATLTVVFAIVLALSGPRPRLSELAIAALLGQLYVIAYSVEFESPLGDSVPTEPVLVAALLLLPPRLVPSLILLTLAAYELARPTDGHRTPRHLAIRVISSFHSLGPALVLVTFADPSQDLSAWAIYLLALGAQFGFDFFAASVRCWGLGERVRVVAGPLTWTFLGDFLLAPIGLAAVLATDSAAVAVGFVAGPVVFIRLIALDRARQVDYQVELGAAVIAARAEALIDALTGLANRRAWEAALADATTAMRTTPGVQASLVLADLDNLKVANDTHGHDTGDRLIIGFAEVLRSVAPTGATVARVGGDEFACLVTHDGAFQPELLVHAVRDAASRARIPLPMGGELAVRASLGWATTDSPHSLGDAYRSADKSVFAAKARRHAPCP